MRIKPKLSLVVMFFLPIVLIGQQISIRGEIKDIQNRSIQNASVSIFDENENHLGYNFSDEKGFYIISIEKPSSVKIHIEVSCLGYYMKRIDIIKQTDIVQDFVLTEKIESLKEVIIEASQKIRIERDTTTIKVSSFGTKTDQTVEDILKKLPGIEVLKDGTIKAHGKNIDKLLIEGDDLFNENYKLLSKNLDVKVLDAVQIIDHFEDNPILKKLDNSDKVALNLKLKKGKNNVWFGTIALGCGVVSTNRWKESLNIGLLKKKMKFFYFSDYNNLGEQSVDLIYKNVLDQSSFSSDRLEYKAKTLYHINNNDIPFFSKSQSIFNKSFLNALSFTKKLNSKLSLRGVIYIADDIQNQNSFAETRYAIDNTPISFTENNFYISHKTLASIELELKYFANDKNYISNLFILKNSPNRFNNNLFFNTDQINQSSSIENYTFYNHFNHTYQLKSHKLLNNYVYFGNDKIDEKSTVRSPFLNTFLNTNSNDDINQIAYNKLFFAGIKTKLISKFRKWDVINSLQIEYKQEEFKNIFQANNISFPDYQNNLKLKHSKISFDHLFRYNFSEKIDCTANLCFLNSFFNTLISNNTIYLFNPTLSINIKKTGFGNFSVSYSENSNLPEISQMNSNYQLIDYRSFLKGTPYNKPLKNAIVSLHYTLFNDEKRYSIVSSLLYIKSNSIFNTESTVTNDFNFSNYKQTNGGESYTFNFSFVNYIRTLKIASKIENTQMWNSLPINVNSTDYLTAKNYSNSIKYSATSYFKFPINLDCGFTYNYSQSIFNTIESNVITKEIFLNINYSISKYWIAEFNNSYFYVNQKNYSFNNLIINYNPKESRFSYRLLFNNIRNENEYTYISISNYTIYRSSVNLVPRYLICMVKYRF